MYGFHVRSASSRPLASPAPRTASKAAARRGCALPAVARKADATPCADDSALEAAARAVRGAAFAVTGGLLSAMVAGVLTAAPAIATPDLAVGRNVFDGNCAACHQGGRNVVIPEKTLDKAALEQYLEGGFNREAIIYQVSNGKGAMPAWEDRLSEDEIQSVAEYVFTTADAGKW